MHITFHKQLEALQEEKQDAFIINEVAQDWKEMYKVFNMGHRMELYVSEEIANDIINISNSYNVAAQIIGRVESSDVKKLTIKTSKGTYIY